MAIDDPGDQETQSGLLALHSASPEVERQVLVDERVKLLHADGVVAELGPPRGQERSELLTFLVSTVVESLAVLKEPIDLGDRQDSAHDAGPILVGSE